MILRRAALATATALLLAAPAAAQGPVLLREAPAPGAEYRISARVDLTGQLSLPAEKPDAPAPPPVEMRGRSALEYDERLLDAGATGRPAKALRLYRRVDFERTVGDQPQEARLRPAVRRVVLLRHGHREVPFSPDGPLTWGEIDLISKDVFTPALAALLPDRPVAAGDRWTAGAAAVEELTDLESIDGAVQCRFEDVTAVNGRRLARIRFAGTVRGVNEDGPNRQQLDGSCYFDLDSNHISYLTLEGTHFLLDKDGRTAGQVKGRFVLTRQQVRTAELRDDVVRGLALEPTAENTLLLYEHPGVGVRFHHPRRWRVGVVRGRQVTLDEVHGSGLLITVEPPTAIPSSIDYLAENRAFLTKQGAKLLRTDPPRALTAELEHHGLDVELNGRRERMEYFVVRQATGGATLAARLLPNDLAALQRDVERIARSLQASVPSGPLKAVPK